MFRRLVFSCLSLVFLSVASALDMTHHPEPKIKEPWQGDWIGVAENSLPNQWLSFRAAFDLEETVNPLVVRIAVDTKYWLWINGRLAVDEGGLKRGPTPADSYYDEIDVTPFLKQGSNTVAVLVWHFGKDGFSHKNSGRAGLVFEAWDPSRRQLVLASGPLWKVRVASAFLDTAEPKPNFRLAESNVRYDARMEDRDLWFAEGFDDRSWDRATFFGKPPAGPWGALVPRPIPFWRQSTRLSYESTSVVATDSGASQITARLPGNFQVRPWFRVKAPAGLEVKIETDNYRGGGEPNVRAEYVTRDGEQEFTCYGWMNGHSVIYSVPAGVEVTGVGYYESGYATAPEGDFVCDDAFLNRLRTKAVRTLDVTMRDNFMDCPDRERAQWWGDVVIELGEIFYSFDRRADALVRKAMLELCAWQKPDGLLFSPIPAGNWTDDLPQQMLAAVGTKGFWTYILYSGDKDVIPLLYPSVKRYLSLWSVDESGILKGPKGGWPWGDWGEKVDMDLLEVAWLYDALSGCRNLALAQGLDSDARALDELRARIQKGFDQRYWTGEGYRSPQFQGDPDDRANGLAVVSGLAGRERFTALCALLERQKNASPYMEKYVLEALCQMGRSDLARARMQSRYKSMVENTELTTLWEGWGIGKEGYGGGTSNHAWSGGPLTLFSQYFAGIAPAAPGFSQVSIEPQPGGLNEIDAAVRTPHGHIRMKWRRAEGRVSLDLDVPSGVTASLLLTEVEVAEGGSLEINGERVRPVEGQESVKGARFCGREKGVKSGLRWNLTEGHWKFSAPAAAVDVQN